ncbi:hypothetical protein M378DRAFT_158905, partial [Amanita muscaria Koide BX008]
HRNLVSATCESKRVDRCDLPKLPGVPAAVRDLEALTCNSSASVPIAAVLI